MSATTENVLQQRILTCMRCGVTFECGSGGGQGGCWCMDETTRLPMPTEHGGDCLCPACLRSAAGASSPGRTNSG